MIPIVAFNRRFRSLHEAWQFFGKPRGLSYKSVLLNFNRGNASIEDCLTKPLVRMRPRRPVKIGGKVYTNISVACEAYGVDRDCFYHFKNRNRARWGKDIEAAFFAFLEPRKTKISGQSFRNPMTILGVTYPTGWDAWQAISQPLGIPCRIVRRRFNRDCSDLVKVFTNPLRITKKTFGVQKNEEKKERN